MSIHPRLIFRWAAFLLAAGYCIRTLAFSGWDAVGGPFRFLTVWALFFSFFAFSRMMAIEEGVKQGEAVGQFIAQNIETRRTESAVTTTE